MGDDLDELGSQEIYLNDMQFDPNLVPAPTILLVGKRFAGKSTASVAISEIYNVPRWCILAGTMDTADYWSEKLGSSATVKEANQEGIDYLLKMLKYQEDKVRIYKKILKQPFPKKYYLGLIFDDVTSKRVFRNNPVLEELFSNGRHYKTVIIISCQYLKQLPPGLRTNCDYIVMMHLTKSVASLLHTEYIEVLDPPIFLQILRAVTGQKDSQGKDLYNGLVFDNTIKSSNVSEIFKVFRQRPGFDPEKVLLGDVAWREYNQRNFKDKSVELAERAYRKSQRLERLRQYQAAKQQRRQQSMFAGNYNLDADYFSDDDEKDVDSDQEEGKSNNPNGMPKQDTIQVKSKKGHGLQLYLNKGSRVVPPNSNQNNNGFNNNNTNNNNWNQGLNQGVNQGWNQGLNQGLNQGWNQGLNQNNGNNQNNNWNQGMNQGQGLNQNNGYNSWNTANGNNGNSALWGMNNNNNNNATQFDAFGRPIATNNGGFNNNNNMFGSNSSSSLYNNHNGLGFGQTSFNTNNNNNNEFGFNNHGFGSNGYNNNGINGYNGSNSYNGTNSFGSTGWPNNSNNTNSYLNNNQERPNFNSWSDRNQFVNSNSKPVTSIFDLLN